ncbi:MAG: hypothetical protein EBZ77_12395, partial [Chitinophagia bacterium]|nr:hypothetical protein [Chitinophagia bacterium]
MPPKSKKNKVVAAPTEVRASTLVAPIGVDFSAYAPDPKFAEALSKSQSQEAFLVSCTEPTWYLFFFMAAVFEDDKKKALFLKVFSC